ncbi:hypothetical protein BT69DRAFT_572352 [Atractiella rhizophila]|nr:hypothetical protein BT69DRAFT_572352 [Atractiella rhizophila]
MSHLLSSLASTSRSVIFPTLRQQARFKAGAKGAKGAKKATNSNQMQGKQRAKMGFKPAKTPKGGGGKKGEEAKFKEALWGSYDNPAPTPEERMDLLVPHIIPDPETHETITRAWQLHQRHERESRDDLLQRKFASLQNALKELERINPPLFFTAVGGGPDGEGGRVFGNAMQSGKKGLSLAERGRERLEGLFPRDVTVPMEYLGRGREAELESVWDEEWKMPAHPAEETK